ncbi:MAG: hypothetical protein HYV39_02670 [Candidatus Levybacteria bacterium]|nr:hypothetical protein [Candidatus Levybacteria bacterium]
MKLIFFLMFLMFLAIQHPVLAIAVENPLAVPNNKFGIHILFPQELDQAAALVNANGGDWGYVTIPIQAGDKNLQKWQKFMDKARGLHVIPIVRLATEGDFFNTKVWRKPEATDVLDFANFLNSLEWPTKNRYVVVFNEVNRGDEWGGTPNPAEYADILQYAATVFKNKSQDFFIITAGLDNAAPTVDGTFINQYDFLRLMHTLQPLVFSQIDGIASHSYPNPGFAQPPQNQGSMGTASFRLERALIKDLGRRELPVFITETGWTKDAVLESRIPNYYTQAFLSIWSDPGIVAVTPFLLRAETGSFKGFSLIQDNGATEIYRAIEKLPKIKGQPTVVNNSVSLESNAAVSVLGTRNFSQHQYSKRGVLEIPERLKILVKWLWKI